ncbi:hypothetical protein [Amycolatopsis sp. lyj-346]|uniref:hypothetical protein n=1 Tax=Amycolatopsis sp. lyj-346 TaxID=2789289 RepID=UPI003978AD7B
MCSGQLAGDAFLFGLQYVERDGVGVPGLHQLELLVVQVLLACLLSVEFGAVAFLASLQLSHDLLPDIRDAQSGELDAAPVVRD